MNKYLVAAGFYAVFLHPLMAAPPSDMNLSPEIKDWYHSLTRPDYPGASCCSYYTDCREVEYRVKDNHYEVFIDRKSFSDGIDEWVEVPTNKILARENPTGRGVACWMHALGVLCFVPGNGT